MTRVQTPQELERLLLKTDCSSKATRTCSSSSSSLNSYYYHVDQDAEDHQIVLVLGRDSDLKAFAKEIRRLRPLGKRWDIESVGHKDHPDWERAEDLFRAIAEMDVTCLSLLPMMNFPSRLLQIFLQHATRYPLQLHMRLCGSSRILLDLDERPSSLCLLAPTPTSRYHHPGGGCLVGTLVQAETADDLVGLTALLRMPVFQEGQAARSIHVDLRLGSSILRRQNCHQDVNDIVELWRAMGSLNAKQNVCVDISMPIHPSQQGPVASALSDLILDGSSESSRPTTTTISSSSPNNNNHHHNQKKKKKQTQFLSIVLDPWPYKAEKPLLTALEALRRQSSRLERLVIQYVYPEDQPPPATQVYEDALEEILEYDNTRLETVQLHLAQHDEFCVRYDYKEVAFRDRLRYLLNLNQHGKRRFLSLTPQHQREQDWVRALTTSNQHAHPTYHLSNLYYFLRQNPSLMSSTNTSTTS